MINENDAVETQATETTKPVPREIIRGRMPVVIVYMVHYLANHIGSDGEKAKAFATTVGKISDVMKGRNFGYVTEDFRPTQAQKDEGKAWLERHPGGAECAQPLIDILEKIEVATAEQASAFEALRSSSRGRAADGNGDPVAPDGEKPKGRGKNKSKPAGAAPTGSEATADALLD